MFIIYIIIYILSTNFSPQFMPVASRVKVVPSQEHDALVVLVGLMHVPEHPPFKPLNTQCSTKIYVLIKETILVVRKSNFLTEYEIFRPNIFLWLSSRIIV